MQSTLVTADNHTPAADNRADKRVFPRVREAFGFRARKAREIMGMRDTTAAPQTPAYFKGVLNLRGKVIPVADLRLKFGLPEIEYTAHACMIAVQVQRRANSMSMGIVADGVGEARNLAAADIEDTRTSAMGQRHPACSAWSGSRPR